MPGLPRDVHPRSNSRTSASVSASILRFVFGRRSVALSHLGAIERHDAAGHPQANAAVALDIVISALAGFKIGDEETRVLTVTARPGRRERQPAAAARAVPGSYPAWSGMIQICVHLAGPDLRSVAEAVLVLQGFRREHRR